MASARQRKKEPNHHHVVVDVQHHHHQFIAQPTKKKTKHKTAVIFVCLALIIIAAGVNQIIVTQSVVSSSGGQAVEEDYSGSLSYRDTSSTADGENDHEADFKKHQQQRNEKLYENEAITDYTFDNVLYFNSLFYPAGRVFMEKQLESFGIRSPRRIELVSGNQAECGKKQTCLDRLRIASTYEWMLRFPNYYLGKEEKALNNQDNYNGTTLIWHRDDIQITDMEILKGIVATTINPSSSHHQYPHWKVLQLQCDKQKENDIQQQEQLLPKGEIGSSGISNFKMVPGKCNRTHGILWRTADDLVFKIKPYLTEKDMNLQTAIGTASSSVLKGKTYCLVAVEGAGVPSYCHINRNSNSKNVQNSEHASEKEPIISRIRNFRQKATIQDIREEVAKVTIPNPYGPHPIERIYYSNLEKNVLRRRIMEGWLRPLQERYKSSIRNHNSSNRTTTTTNPSYKRIQAIRGDPNNCVSKKNGTIQCVGISGISRTLLSIIDEEDSYIVSSSNGANENGIDEGLTMVLEDDYVVTDDTFDRLEESLNLVPDDWDIIRFDCWGGVEKFGFIPINKYVVQTTNRPNANNETLIPPCGGAYSMLWRRRRDENNSSSSIYYKLREMWSKTPYNGVDCAIPFTPSVKSYCVNIGLGDEYKIPSELTDIIKLNEIEKRNSQARQSRAKAQLQMYAKKKGSG